MSQPHGIPTISQPQGTSKGTIHLVHLYPREMSIYGDLGNTQALEQRIVRHGYTVVRHEHHPGGELPLRMHLIVGGGGQDSGQVRVTEDLERIAPTLRIHADAGVPMLMICGMYQLFGNAFITVDGTELPGLGIFNITTRGGAVRMIGPVAMETDFGPMVGYENHSGATTLGSNQAPFGRVRAGFGNNKTDGHEGARTGNVFGSYLHGPILPANPRFADALIGYAAQVSTQRPFEPGVIDDRAADEARNRQWNRLVGSR